MDNVDVPVFDDPALKTALRRHFCSECCPGRLRQRLAQMCAESSPPELSATPLRPEMKPEASPALRPAAWQWRSHRAGLAIAAVLVVAIGSTSFLLLHSSPQAIPPALEAALIARHDGCIQHAVHEGPQVPQDFARMGQYLRQELNHPVLAADMTREYSHFRGAAICPVGSVPAAHLVFDQDGRTLSVFSLPASAYPSLEDHKSYEGVADGHAVVARREGSAIYCMVEFDAKSTLSARDLDKTLRQHESEATVALAPGTPHVYYAGVVREP